MSDRSSGTGVNQTVSTAPAVPSRDDGDLGMRINRISLVETAINMLRERIRSGAWTVGDRLPSEVELAHQLGISRAPLREATRALVHAGLLAARQGDGTYVVAVDESAVALNRMLSTSSFLDVLEVRRGIDSEAVRLAAVRRTAADLKAMERHLADRRDAAVAGDRTAFSRADVSFHLAVAAAAHNALLYDLYEGLSLTIRQSVESHASVDDPHYEAVDNHEELFDAIRDRDADAALAIALSIVERQIEASRQPSARARA